MPTIAELLMPPLIAFALATAAGIALATLRAPRTGAGWIALDAAVLLPIFLPASLVANAFLAASNPSVDRLVAWMFAATLAALPVAYLPVRLGLAVTVPRYRDTAALLGYNCPTRLLRIDLPLLWPTLALAGLLAATRVAAEWYLVIGNMERLNVLSAALGVLAIAAAIGASVGLTRLPSRP